MPEGNYEELSKWLLEQGQGSLSVQPLNLSAQHPTTYRYVKTG